MNDQNTQETETTDEAAEPQVVWRVTRTDDGKVDLFFGAKLADAPFDDDAKVHMLGKALIGLGTQLLGSTTDPDGWEDDDEWDDD